MGATWNVEPAHDLDIAASLECAVTGVVKNDRPSGGSVVTLKGPVGFAVSFIHGQKPAPELPRTYAGPAEVHAYRRREGIQRLSCMKSLLPMNLPRECWGYSMLTHETELLLRRRNTSSNINNPPLQLRSAKHGHPAPEPLLAAREKATRIAGVLAGMFWVARSLIIGLTSLASF
jgi:hypothetical protein